MKKFINAELVELNIKATSEYNPNAEGMDATFVEIAGEDVKAIVPGDPYPSGTTNSTEYSDQG